MKKFREVFTAPKSIIGVIHLKGDTDEDIKARAKKEIGLYIDGGLDAVIFEDYFGSYPYPVWVLDYAKTQKLPVPYGVNCLNFDSLNFKLARDPRTTKVGRFLRKTSLDELPQLFNIIAGTLSLVGPRPVLQEETELYGADRELLLSCKPGLTGLWQTKGRSNVTYENGARQALELKYVRERCFLLDLKILLWTVGAVVRMDGAR